MVSDLLLLYYVFIFLLLRIILRLCPWHVYTWIGSLSSCWASCPDITSLALLLHTDKHLWYVEDQVSSHKPDVWNLWFTGFDEFVDVHVYATVPHLSSIELTLLLPSESEGKASRKDKLICKWWLYIFKKNKKYSFWLAIILFSFKCHSAWDVYF